MPPSLFLGVYAATYGYTPQSDKEIAFEEGDLLCVLEKPADDDWWKAKKKGNTVDDDEPVGLVPNNYIEEAKPIGKYRALYDYTNQTEEELAFSEDDLLDVYDNSDPDWALVGLDGRFGYAPANYIEKAEGSPTVAPAVAVPAAKKHVAFMQEDDDDKPPTPDSPAPVQRRTPPAQEIYTRPARAYSPAPPSPVLPDRRSSPPERPVANRINKSGATRSPPQQFQDSEDDSDGPGLPLKKPATGRGHDNAAIPPGFRIYSVNEVDSKKKRAAVLGLGPNRIILLPDKSTRPREEWTVDNMTGYNHEGKHVFLDLKHPTRSLHLHAGSTSTAEEIISAMGELRGMRNAAGMEDVIAAVNSGGKSDNSIGTVLYDFPAQGEDEVSVTAGDEVVILDDSNDEWWLVRRQVNGAEGVLPSSYVEKGRKTVIQPVSGIKESPGVRSDGRRSQHNPSASSGSGGVPERGSSLAPRDNRKSAAPTKSKPEATQIRSWTDRSGSFKVDAQFLGCRDGKIHLHKTNGVKIAVPVSRMSAADLRYVEDRTGISLDEDKPLSDILKEQRKNQSQAGIAVDRNAARNKSSPKLGDYDWFDFFLGCGVDVNNCQRYATNFQKDEMEESSLELITPEAMRTLGMKEGDILRVTKKLDEKYGRIRKIDGDGNSLFTDKDGNLKSSRQRPPPAVQIGAINAEALQSQKETSRAPTPAKTPPPSSKDDGFADNAWDPRPTKTQTPVPQPTPPPPEPQHYAPPPLQPPALTGALGGLAGLSLDTPPLQPTIQAPPPAPVYAQPQAMPPPLFQQQPMTTGVYQAPRSRPAAPTITGGTLGIAPPPQRPLSAPQQMQPQQQFMPMQPMGSSYSGQPGIMNFMPPPQINYQVTGYSQPQQFPSGSNFAQSGFGLTPLQQQMTGIQPAGYNLFQNNTGMGLPPPLIPQNTAQQLMPQPTGPPPPVRFGVAAKKLAPQPTGRANLNKATPDNPFGF